MEGKLKHFLHERGVSDDSIARMEQDKVDAFVIQAADESVLGKYLPQPGDRLAVQAFCTGHTPQVAPSKINKQNKILATLRKKLLLKSTKGNHTKVSKQIDCDDSDNSSGEDMPKNNRRIRLSGNCNASKETRKIEIGWLHYGENGYAQVRKKRGGGTRRVDIPKDANQYDILREAKSLFFNNGISPMGKSEDFDFAISDFSETLMDQSEENVGDMYKRTGMGILRFYMATKIKPGITYTSISNSPSTTASAAAGSPIFLETAMGTNQSSSCVTISDDDTPPDLSEVTDFGIPLQSLLDQSESEVFFNFNAPINFSASNVNGDVSTVADTILYPGDGVPIFAAAASVLQDVTTANPLTNVGDPQTTKPVVEMVIHRGAFGFRELVGYFKDATICNKIITIRRVLSNGEREIAEDTGGVLRDLLSEFWNDFYTKCTLGRVVKVPSLRHDFATEEWKSLGRILLYGWENAGYWPISLSKTFLLNTLDNGAFQNEELMADFANFISLPDKEVMEKALQSFESVEPDDLLDTLDAHECKTQVNAENVKSTFLEIAHKELIQMPMFVSDCWREVFRGSRLTASKLVGMYSSLQPTNKGVLKLLAFPDNSDGQDAECIKHLKRYVKELDPKKLGLFLRFCTGADLVTVEKITVEFVDLKGLARRPVSHKCGCVLQLPKKFENFMEFRSEFDGVLESNVWVMDMV